MRPLEIKSCDVIETAAGWVGLGYSEGGLCWLNFPLSTRAAAVASLERLAPEARPGGPADVPSQLQAYFAGERVAFDLRLDLSGGTPFQQQVWNLLRAIPYGEVRSYGWLADQVGKPGGARAVGRAVGSNPVPIVVPCHRVIGADGGLGGFGGGLGLKRQLLELEGAYAAAGKSRRSRSRATRASSNGTSLPPIA